MKIRDLTWRKGNRMVPAWPPRWVGSSHSGGTSPMPDDGVLESFMYLENDTLLKLIMRFDAREHTGTLTWDAPPPLDAIESLLKANLGREIRTIGDLDI
jgi:hypothetical protein